ncbi:MAG TPA: protein kinase [Polyangiaceae bacterium]|nr:protein kinase [Polyangiaceae bacterium]
MTALPDSLLQNPSELLQPGDQLGRYQLLCAVAQGGMGQVWAARETGRLGLPRVVAIKTALPGSVTTYDKIQELFLDEAQVAASIDHPNVCKILELGQAGQTLFIAMEWIHGASLQTLLRCSGSPAPLDYGVAAHIIAQACSGLHAAHELLDEDGVPLEVVHRDATPHNVLITTTGEVKIVDFGIVKSRNQLHQATEAGEIKGKIAYLAPEQLRGTGVDRRTDIFSLGCALYFATTGRGPFNGSDAGSTIMRIMQGEYRKPSNLISNYPKQLEEIARRALAPNPSDRFQTCEEMRLALETFVCGLKPAIGCVDVAAALNGNCGQMIEQRRIDIRSAQKLFESQPGSRMGWERNSNASSGTYPVGNTAPTLRTTGPGASSEVIDTRSTTIVEGELPPRKNSRSLWIGLGVAVLAALGVTSLWRIHGAPGRSAQQLRPAVTAPTPQGAASRGAEVAPTIEITVQAVPASAVLSIDNGPILPTPQRVRMPLDRRPHALAFRADGYEELTRMVTFDQSQAISVELAAQRPAREPRVRRLKPARGPARSNLLSAPAAPRDSLPSAPATTASESAPGTLQDPFSEPLVRQPPRHNIDETDPFGSQP